MGNNKDSDIFFIVGGIIALIAGALGAGYMANNKDKDQRQGIEPNKSSSSSCNKCPFSK